MKGKKLTSAGKITVAVIISMVLATGSVVLIIHSYFSAEEDYRFEHTLHLFDIAYSTDRNIDVVFKNCLEFLSYYFAAVDETEENYLETGDSAEMLGIMRSLPLSRSNYVSMVILLKDEDVILCTECGEDCRYTFPKGIDNICISESEEGEKYFAVLSDMTDNGLRYGVLLDMDSFFRNIAGIDMEDEYWLVLYSDKLGCYLQNNGNSTEFFNITYEEAMERNDGLSIIAVSEKTNTQNSVSYDYRLNGTNTTSLLSVLPSSDTSNGFFTIGVAVDSTHFVTGLKLLFWQTVLYCLIVIAIVSFLLMYLMYTRRESIALSEKNRSLEKQNAEMEALIEKQQELAHHQRLETIGILTSGIAHEFNNLLTPIMGYSIMSLGELDESDTELKENLTEIYESAVKAKSLVSRLSALSRKNNSVTSSLISPDSVVDHVIETIQPSLPKNVKIRLDCRCPGKCLYANEVQIGQLLINLALNSFHAMEQDGGVLTVATLESDAGVELSVTDTGCGIPSEIINTIFEPFFTTKEQGHGTGLGLAIVKQIAEEHGGTISVESKVGQGTKITVTFPKAKHN